MYLNKTNMGQLLNLKLYVLQDIATLSERNLSVLVGPIFTICKFEEISE